MLGVFFESLYTVLFGSIQAPICACILLLVLCIINLFK